MDSKWVEWKDSQLVAEKDLKKVGYLVEMTVVESASWSVDNLAEGMVQESVVVLEIATAVRKVVQWGKQRAESTVEK